jgi:hypothetical protein
MLKIHFFFQFSLKSADSSHTRYTLLAGLIWECPLERGHEGEEDSAMHGLLCMLF